MSVVTTTQKRLNQLTYEVANAKKLRDLYVENKSSKRYYWIKRYETLLNEQRTLQGKSAQSVEGVQSKQVSAGQPINKEQIKKQIISANKKAQAADTDMRNALKNKESTKASAYRQDRDRHNAEVRRLQGILSGTGSTGTKAGQGGGSTNNTAKPLTAIELKRYNTLKNSMKYWKKTSGQERNVEKHQAEFNDLENRFNNSQSKSPEGAPGKNGATGSTGKVFSREQLKVQIAEANKKAQAADTDMRNALKNKEPTKATANRQDRDRHNAEVKRLQGILSGTTVTNEATGTEGDRGDRGKNGVVNPLTSAELKRYNTLKNSMKYWKKTSGQERNITKHQAEFNDLENRFNKSQGGQAVQPLSTAELKEYTRLKSSMDWWKSHNEVKNIQKNQARFDALKYRYEKTKGKVQAEQSGGGDIVTKARNAYLKNTGVPDSAHNPILADLLLKNFSEEKVKDQNEAIVDAYKAVRPTSAQVNKTQYGATGAPQVVAKSGTALTNLKGTNFFVRDYLQVQGKGGSKSAPWKVSGLTIHDGAQKSPFQGEFDNIVSKINDETPDGTKELKGFSNIAHRDAIQLIPIEKKDNKTVSQLMGATMRHIKVSDNKITSTGELQGIFATDGAFQNLSIVNNTIDTQGNHTISFNGMLSGTIEGNKNKDGLLPKNKIELYPLRILGGTNIYVMGFNNKRGDKNNYAYESIKGDKQEVTDLRHVHPTTDGATYWKNVHMPTLKSIPRTTYNKVINDVNQIRRQRNIAVKAARDARKPANEESAIKAKYQGQIEKVVGKMMKTAGGVPD